MSCPFTPSTSHIKLGAVRRNFRRLGEPGELMPVIKADAYGHGLLAVARTLAEAGAERFAVGLPAEGTELRKAGFSQQIVPLLGCMSKEDWERARSLTPLIGSFEDLKMAAAQGGPAWEIAIKIDTGMGRLGFAPEEMGPLLEALASAPALRPALVVSHLACADMPEDEAFTQAQTRAFMQAFAALRARYPAIRPSLANSAATLSGHNPEGGIARPGLALYGGNPLPGRDTAGLEWAMDVSAPVLRVKRLKPGQSVSYGRAYTAKKDMLVAVIGAGYAQGVNRALSNKMEVLLRGKRVPQIGRICMGMTLVDASAAPEAQPGDRAWILGGEALPGEKPVTALELAEKIGTIPYEALCLLGSLNPRVYTD